MQDHAYYKGLLGLPAPEKLHCKKADNAGAGAFNKIEALTKDLHICSKWWNIRTSGSYINELVTMLCQRPKK
ncbi:MAG TPA: hypothetical protein VFN30_13380 [Chitinophagaceae bacterium]|nr:hypothetical protein [Chitinophagaceae bacterium]